MPELPEVERGRRLAESVASGRTITAARCGRDPIVFQGISPQRMRRALVGRRVEAVRRRGKQLWFDLDAGPHPLFHFGMTGAFRVPGQTTLQLESGPKAAADEAWPPKFTKIHLTFDDGGELVMTNARRLGRIGLRDDPEAEPPISRLGFDPLLDLPAPKAFTAMLADRSTVMKALLLDQSFAAGVGNWIADEVLYQAKIAPARRAHTLSAEEARRVHARLRSVIRKAVEVNAEKTRYPRTWLFHRRWGKNADAVTASGAPIVHATIGGRTTAWVPSVQK